ncbi:unnamed protein product [Durusdinium trenchii]|uniref:Uncharacterized protein n=1 Tax=Durusdinium trenchii TaxID=1381693 RepID=A0ABP0SNY0_9DINO
MRKDLAPIQCVYALVKQRSEPSAPGLEEGFGRLRAVLEPTMLDSSSLLRARLLPSEPTEELTLQVQLSFCGVLPNFVGEQRGEVLSGLDRNLVLWLVGCWTKLDQIIVVFRSADAPRCSNSGPRASSRC